MGALEILEQWVKPLTGPLQDFLNETQVLASTHQSSVSSFNNLVQDLTDTNGADAFTGDAADQFVEMTGEYLTSEIALSGTPAALAGPLAEAGTTCTTMVTGVGEGVTTAVAAAPEVDALVTVTAVVDVTTVAQGGLDVPEDVVAAGATSLTIWIVIGILTGLAIAIGIVWWAWHNSMNNIANSPMPKLPNKPTAPVPPQMSAAAEKWTHLYPDIPIEYIEWVLRKKGLTDAGIRKWLDDYMKLLQKYPNAPKMFVALLLMQGHLSPEQVAAILQNYTASTITPASLTAEQQALLAQLVQEFPNVDSGFLSRLIATNLNPQQIRAFLTNHATDMPYITMLYTQLQGIEGVDRVLKDLANGSPGSYKGSLYQLEWALSVKPDLDELELYHNGVKSADAKLKDGTIVVDLKSYLWYGQTPAYAKMKGADFARQLRNYLRDYPGAKVEFIFDSDGGPVPQEVKDALKSVDPNVIIESWPNSNPTP